MIIQQMKELRLFCIERIRVKFSRRDYSDYEVVFSEKIDLDLLIRLSSLCIIGIGLHASYLGRSSEESDNSEDSSNNNDDDVDATTATAATTATTDTTSTTTTPTTTATTTTGSTTCGATVTIATNKVPLLVLVEDVYLYWLRCMDYATLRTVLSSNLLAVANEFNLLHVISDWRLHQSTPPPLEQIRSLIECVRCGPSFVSPGYRAIPPPSLAVAPYDEMVAARMGAPADRRIRWQPDVTYITSFSVTHDEIVQIMKYVDIGRGRSMSRVAIRTILVMLDVCRHFRIINTLGTGRDGRCYVIDNCRSVRLYDSRNNHFEDVSLSDVNCQRYIVDSDGDLIALGSYCKGHGYTSNHRFRDQRWSRIESLPVSTMGFGVANAGGYVYVIGGERDTPRGPVSTNAVWRYRNDTWTHHSVMVSRRKHPTCSVVDDVIMVRGGMQDGRVLHTMEQYDLAEPKVI